MGDIRMLHVDDNSDFAELAALRLSRKNDRIESTVETRASDGLDRLATTDFDCVVSDYNMPSMNGLEFLEAVREDYAALPFILFTGKGSEEIASDAISAGVTDYLQKGGGSDTFTMLANRVTNAVEAAAAQGRLERREREFRTLLEQSPVPTLLFDESGEVIYANPSAVEFTGIDGRDALVGSAAGKYVHPDDQSESDDRIRRVLDDREPVDEREYRICTGDGEIRHARGTVVPATFEGRQVAQAVLVDVTEYKTG